MMTVHHDFNEASVNESEAIYSIWASLVGVGLFDLFQSAIFLSNYRAVLQSNLNKKAKVYTHIAKTFTFLVNVTISEDGLPQGVGNFIKAYPENLKDSFLMEVKQFHMYGKQEFLDF